MPTKLFVLPVRNGGWGVVVEGQRQPMLQHSTRSRAVALAQEALRQQGGGEVVVLNRSGRVIESNAVKP